MYIPIYEDVVATHERIRPYIHRTPVLTSSYFNDRTGAELFFKCENFQKAGVFKARGASNAVFGLSEEQAAKGVATHSSGNHGLSLSYAAGRRGIKATVVMPRTAPEAKKEAVRGYGGTGVECEPLSTILKAVRQPSHISLGLRWLSPQRLAMPGLYLPRPSGTQIRWFSWNQSAPIEPFARKFPKRKRPWKLAKPNTSMSLTPSLKVHWLASMS